MKPKTIFFIGYVIACMLLGYSCKNQVFLKQKYVHGNLKASTQVNHTKSFIKKSEAAIVHPPDVLINEGEKSVTVLLAKQSPKPKTVVVNTITKKILSQPLCYTTEKPFSFTSSLLKTNKKTKPADSESKGSHLFRLALLTVLFWVVMGMLYSRTLLAVQVASMVVTFHILGYVLLAVLVWLMIYYLFKVFGKKEIKD